MSAAYHSLNLIKELSAAIREGASLQEAEAWWSQVLTIESDLEFNPNTTKRERELLQGLRSGVSRAILSIREKYPHADLGGARVALSALQSCIERRTIGVDGYPLRR